MTTASSLSRRVIIAQSASLTTRSKTDLREFQASVNEIIRIMYISYLYNI